MLLLGVDHSHEPRHDEVDEANAAREVLGVEELDLVRVKFAVVELALLLQTPAQSASVERSESGRQTL